MATLHCHIGVPKTASSFIQAWLYQNRAALGDHGVFVPKVPVHAHRIAVEFLEGEPWDKRADIVQIRQVGFDAAIADIKSGLNGPFENVIVSSEYFYHADPADVSRTFQEHFGSMPNVVVYIRSQDSLIASGYNQDVKRLGKQAKRPRPAYEPIYDWGLLLDSWSKEIGKDRMKVVSFDLSARNGTALQDFVAACCPSLLEPLSKGVFKDSTLLNDSLPADLLEFKRVANALGEWGLADWLENALRDGYAGPRYGVDGAEAAAWRDLYRASNERVAREYFDADGAEAVFPPSEGQARTDLEGRLPVETVAKLLAYAVKRQESESKAAKEQIRTLQEQVARLAQRLAKAS